MARPTKKGLDYFSFDVDFFQDIKIRKLIKYQSGKSISIYTYLLCNIYKNGYYVKWDNELPFIISESTGFDEAYINEVIKSCLNVGLFSNKMYQDHQVLTSKSIQDRYNLIQVNSKRKAVIDEFIIVNTEETTINSESSTQSKVKESKVKESKVINTKIPIFKKWLKYRDEIKKPIKVKSTLESLVKRFNKEPLVKCEWVVNHSIENNYQGLFWNQYKPSKKTNNNYL